MEYQFCVFLTSSQSGPIPSCSNWNLSSDSCFRCRALSYHQAWNGVGYFSCTSLPIQVTSHAFSIKSPNSFEGHANTPMLPATAPCLNQQQNPRSLSMSPKKKIFFKLAPSHCLLFKNTLILILGVFNIHTVDPPNTLASKCLTSSPGSLLLHLSQPALIVRALTLSLPVTAPFHSPVLKCLLLWTPPIFVTCSPN